MIPEDLRQSLKEHIDHVDHPRELAVDVMFAIQDFYGSLTDEGVREAAELLERAERSLASAGDDDKKMTDDRDPLKGGSGA